MSIAKDSTCLIGLDLTMSQSKNGRKEGFETARRSIEIGKRWGNTKIICNSYSHLGLNYASKRQIDSAIYCYQTKIALARKYGSIGFEQNALQSLSYAYFYSDSLDIAIDYANQSLAICEQIHYYSDKSWLLNILTYIYSLKGTNEEAINTALKTLDLAKEQKDEYRIYSAQRMLGMLYLETEEYDKAKAIFSEALIWIDQGEDNSRKLRSRGNLYIEIGKLDLRKKNYDKAVESFKLAIEDLKEKPQYAIVADVLILGSYIDQKRIEAAEQHYKQMLEFYTDQTRDSNPGLDLENGRLLTENGNYNKGITSLNKYLDWSKTSDHQSDSRNLYLSLYQAYNALGKHEEALNAYISFNTIDDSLKAGVQKDNVAKIQSDYELSLKETTIQDLRQQQELNDLRLDQQNQELEVRQLYLILMGFMLLIIAGIVYWLFRRFRLKKKQEETQMRIERAELEVENLQSKQQAEIAEVKNTLFANVSHEFITPLTLIKVPIKNYMNKIPEKDQPIFDGVLNNTDQLLKLIDELLDASRMESGTMELQKSTLLIVEDNLEIRNLLGSTLAPEFEIITANDGEKGEALALKHQPDIVLSDVMMPKKDGFELLGALKTNINSSHIPAVLLTVKADAQSKITGLNQDADDYIAKPFNPQELIARLQNLIRQRKQLQKLFNQNPLVHVKGIKCSDIDDAFFTKARTILAKNYQNGDFSVSDFCVELTLNRNSVHNKIMAFTNDNTSRYIKNFRLEKAAQMLMETTIAISDIYIKNGFNSSQAFNKAFKERFKITPTAFREEKREI